MYLRFKVLCVGRMKYIDFTRVSVHFEVAACSLRAHVGNLNGWSI